MATDEPKKRSITGNLVANMLTEREDDFNYNVTYLATRNIDDLCKIAAKNKSKFSASELRTAYNDLISTAEEELYSASTVEFGFCYHSLGVEGSFIGPKAKFDPTKNKLNIRSIPLAKYRKVLDSIDVLTGEVLEGNPTIITVTDVFTKEVNSKITPGNTLNGQGSRTKIVGAEGKTVGFFFVDTQDETKVTPVPENVLSRNEPSRFSFIIPALPDGTYYLEVATQFGGHGSKMLNDVRRNRFPYPLTVGNGGGDRPEIE